MNNLKKASVLSSSSSNSVRFSSVLISWGLFQPGSSKVRLIIWGDVMPKVAPNKYMRLAEISLPSSMENYDLRVVTLTWLVAGKINEAPLNGARDDRQLEYFLLNSINIWRCQLLQTRTSRCANFQLRRYSQRKIRRIMSLGNIHAVWGSKLFHKESFCAFHEDKFDSGKVLGWSMLQYNCAHIK